MLQIREELLVHQAVYRRAQAPVGFVNRFPRSQGASSLKPPAQNTSLQVADVREGQQRRTHKPARTRQAERESQTRRERAVANSASLKPSRNEDRRGESRGSLQRVAKRDAKSPIKSGK